jgi:hypothetical protein
MMVTTMKNENRKKEYTTPKLQTFGDVKDLTRQNDNNDLTDVPMGDLNQVGYSPTAS